MGRKISERFHGEENGGKVSWGRIFQGRFMGRRSRGGFVGRGGASERFLDEDVGKVL